MRETLSLQAGDPCELSGFRLVGRLGEGAQGVVFLGRDRTGRQAAVKVLHTRLAGDADARRRFLQELAAGKQVAGFGTAQVLDADVDGDRPYVISEYVEGPSLQQLVAEQGPRSGGALERLALGTAMALSAIHRAGVVHRDFKPGNVLLGPDGPRVIDFGIARALDSTATLTAHAVGTPSYMAPEQLGRKAVGPAADVFAWACTMVYAATGAPPFGADTVAAVITRVLTSEPDLSGLPAPLAGHIAACLAKDQADRPGIRQVLDRLLDESQGGAAGGIGASTVGDGAPPASSAAHPTTVVDTPPPAPAVPPPLAPSTPVQPPGGTTGERKERRRWPLAVGVVAALAVLAGVGVWWLNRGDDQKEFTMLKVGSCHMVPATTARQLVPGAHVDTSDDWPTDRVTEFTSTCQWLKSDKTNYRDLKVDVSVQVSVDDRSLSGSEATDGLQRARDHLGSVRRDFRSKADTTAKGGAVATHYGRTAELKGIGDEAVVLSWFDVDDIGGIDLPQTVEIDVRLANAVIVVTYDSGDGQNGRMTPTPEPVVRKRAETAARDVVAALSRCTECTR